MKEEKTALIAMSGGADSSAAAPSVRRSGRERIDGSGLRGQYPGGADQSSRIGRMHTLCPILQTGTTMALLRLKSEARPFDLEGMFFLPAEPGTLRIRGRNLRAGYIPVTRQ